MSKVGVKKSKDIFKEAGRCSGCGNMGRIVVGLGSNKYCAKCKEKGDGIEVPKPSTEQPEEGRVRNIFRIGDLQDGEIGDEG